MGYESTLIVGNKGSATELPGYPESGRHMLMPIATFDLSKMGTDEWTSLLRESPDDETVYWYAELCAGVSVGGVGFGDHAVMKDPYGKPLKRLDFAATIAALEAESDGYRRVAAPLAMLRVFAEQLADGVWRSERLGLWHYGH